MNASLAGFKLQGKKNSLTREQAMGIYDDLKKNFTQYETVAQQKASMNVSAKQKAYSGAAPKAGRPAVEPKDPFGPGPSAIHAMAGNAAVQNTLLKNNNAQISGMWSAFALVLLFAVAKIGLSALEYSGIANVQTASATMASAPAATRELPPQVSMQDNSSQFSPEKIQILTALDSRRSELAEMGKKLDSREEDVKKEEQDLVARTQELRELTATLRSDRDKNDKRKDGQLEQLANVYGAMDPVEAAKLIQQLDVTIALGLLKRMPEKRIGQILSLMQAERALTITKMLSGSPN